MITFSDLKPNQWIKFDFSGSCSDPDSSVATPAYNLIIYLGEVGKDYFTHEQYFRTNQFYGNDEEGWHRTSSSDLTSTLHRVNFEMLLQASPHSTWTCRFLSPEEVTEFLLLL